MRYKTRMNVGGESSSGIVPVKQPNERLGGPQEVVEGRPLTKENTDEPNSHWTPSQESKPRGLDRVRQIRRQHPRWEPCALAARERFCPGGGG